MTSQSPIGTVNFVAPKFIWGKHRDGQFCSPKFIWEPCRKKHKFIFQYLPLSKNRFLTFKNKNNAHFNNRNNRLIIPNKLQK
jgi:hypothetical protein